LALLGPLPLLRLQVQEAALQAIGMLTIARPSIMTQSKAASNILQSGGRHFVFLFSAFLDCLLLLAEAAHCDSLFLRLRLAL
jgi:hypothetical protein